MSKYKVSKKLLKSMQNKKMTPKQQLVYRLCIGVAIFIICFLIGNIISGGPRVKDVYAEEPETFVANTDDKNVVEEKIPELVAEVAEVKDAEMAEVPQIVKAPVVPESSVVEAPPQKQVIDSTHILSQKSTLFSKKFDNLLRTYRPDYAMYLVVDAKTNEILAWGERKDGEIQSKPDFLIRSTFPAASLAKTITTAAALESRQYSIDTGIPMIGAGHTLYKNQLKPKEGRTYETVTLQDAYARSLNAPMGIVGYKVGAKALRNAAAKLGFNMAFPQGIPNKSNYAPPDTGYGLAEVASGFNEQTTLSPLLAAAQIRAILMKRPLEIPHANGLMPYAPEKTLALSVGKFSDNTYYGLRQAMLRTVTHGTGRKNISTRNMARKSYDELIMGGKTGSLDGSDPAGRYEWFAGFAQKKSNPDEAVVLVLMQVHKEIRSQPATQVAAVIFNYWANNTRVKK